MRESLDYKKDKAYKGEHKEEGENKMDEKAAAIADAKASLLGLPTWDECVFNLIFVFLCPTLIALATLGIGPEVTPIYARLLAISVSFGPPLGGAALLLVSQRYTSFKRMFFYPFHKEQFLGAFGFNVVMGCTVAMLPVYHMISMLLLKPGDGIYCQLWGTCLQNA